MRSTTTEPQTAPPPTAHSYAMNELAGVTGLGRRRLYDAIRDGRLIARKFGRRTIVLRSDLEAFLNALERAR